MTLIGTFGRPVGGPAGRRTHRRVVLAVAAAVLLASCTDGTDSASDVERQVEDLAEVSPSGIERYVALGDSFTAAPLVPSTDLANGCFRSDRNYPALLAERLDIDELVDVSCSGATTQDLVRRQQTVQDSSVPPQLRAVTPDTDLVTLGIGGNDFDLFHTLVATCSRLGQETPTGSPCADSLEATGVDLVAQTRRISNRVAASVERVRRKAPDATVLVVGYLRLTPPSGRCPELPFAPGDYGFGEQVSVALNAALEEAAERTGATFVDMYAASEDHHICAEDAWVNGAETLQGEALAFHPFAAGMEAVTDEVLEVLPGALG